MQEQHRVGGLDVAPGALDADALDLVLALAQAGGVEHVQRHAFDLDGLPHHVAGGACHRRDDGQFRPGQRIEQRAFSRIRLAGDDHVHALAQQGALVGARVHALYLLAQRRKLAARIGLLEKVQLFLGEVQRGFDQHAQMHQRLAQRPDLGRERPAERARRAAGGGFGAGVDQVGDGLGLREVDLVVEEGALGELAGPRQPQAGQPRASAGGVDLGGGGEAAREQQLQHHRPAVGLELQYILAGVGMRRRKEQGQPLVDGPARGVEKGQIGGLARQQAAATERAHQRLEPGARHPHDAHRPATGRGGNGRNGLARRRCGRQRGRHASARSGAQPPLRAWAISASATCSERSRLPASVPSV